LFELDSPFHAALDCVVAPLLAMTALLVIASEAKQSRGLTHGISFQSETIVR